MFNYTLFRSTIDDVLPLAAGPEQLSRQADSGNWPSVRRLLFN